MKTTLASTHHLQGVHDLQRKYHKSTPGVGITERGFLTCLFTMEELRTFASEAGIVVAVNDLDVVVGYNILMTIYRAQQYEAYVPLITAYEQLRPGIDLSKVLLARQYCVDESARGGPVVRSLYDVMRSEVCRDTYRFSIGEVDSRNRASMLAARRLLGYTFIGSYAADNIVWNIGERKES
jgi:hypothetical protein